MVESGPVFLAIRFSPGLKPEISGAAALMNRREFAKNELSFTSGKVDFYALFVIFSQKPALTLPSRHVIRSEKDDSQMSGHKQLGRSGGVLIWPVSYCLSQS